MAGGAVCLMRGREPKEAEAIGWTVGAGGRGRWLGRRMHLSPDRG